MGIRFIGILFVLGGAVLTGWNGLNFYKGFTAKALPDQVPVQLARAADETANLTKEAVAHDLEQKIPLYRQRPATGDLLGSLSIPKLGASLPIYHGTSEDELKRGIGHFAKSALPGENNNTVLSGHRDTVFRRLGEVGVGDKLIITTSAGEFVYKVKKVRIVDSDNRTIIVEKPKATLTVSTCYPFRYIGSAKQRFILIGELINKKRSD